MFAVGHMVHCYRGFAGSIRCVECHPTLPLVASCGLDRYVRIHDLEQQHLMNKVTTKESLFTHLLRMPFVMHYFIYLAMGVFLVSLEFNRGIQKLLEQTVEVVLQCHYLLHI